MGRFTNIQRALDNRLRLVETSDNLTVAWENFDFRPTSGTDYVRPTNISGPSNLTDLTSRCQTNPGIYQIDIFVSLHRGTKAFNELSDLLVDHFGAIENLTKDGTEVWIQSISRTSPTKVDAWYSGFIEINYLTYST